LIEEDFTFVYVGLQFATLGCDFLLIYPIITFAARVLSRILEGLDICLTLGNYSGDVVPWTPEEGKGNGA